MLRKGGGHDSPGRSLPSHSGSPSALAGTRNSAGVPVAVVTNSPNQSWLGKSAVRSSEGEEEGHRLYNDVKVAEEGSTGAILDTGKFKADDLQNSDAGKEKDVMEPNIDSMEQKLKLHHKKLKHRLKFQYLLNMK